MGAVKKYNIDFEKCLELERAGWTLTAIAEQIGVSRSWLQAQYRVWKRETFTTEISDIGKVHALHNARWSNQQIADEFGSTIEEVLKALGQEPPKIEEEDHDAEFYGEQDF